MRRVCFTLGSGLLSLTLGCTGGAPIDVARSPTVDSHGPRIVWDLGARPLPEIPLPNDVATLADANSPTGLRVNASMVAPTSFESSIRAGFDDLDGWGTFAPITLSFDDDLDLADLTARMRGDEHRFTDDAVYIVNLRTGVPVPIDMGDGAFVYNSRNPDGYYPNDPRGGQPNLLFETVNEDRNHNHLLDPGEDTNFDGVLNRAAVFPAGASAADNITSFWEPDSRTLVLRPLIPLEERTRYAVVITDRLTSTAGPVRSPFATVAHPAQADVLSGLDAILRTRHPEYYGGLTYRAHDGDSPNAARVVFAWSFTTQTTASQLVDLGRGLNGQGLYAPSLAPITPDFTLAEAASGQNCTADQRDRPFVIRGEGLVRFATSLSDALGVRGAVRDRLIQQYRYVDYVALATVRTPYLMGDPRSIDHRDRWSINAVTGQIQHLGTDTVQAWVVVPKPSAGHQAPFPVAFMGHGYTGNFFDALGYAPNLAAQGIATVGLNAAGHGLSFDEAGRSQVSTILRSICASGLNEALLNDRARDINGDGTNDSGGDFWTAYLFHTRDMVRQSVLDHMQVIRALRAFDGHTLARQDFNHDGNATNDLAGDFNGDGVIDLGGPANGYYTAGTSLGGILTMILGAVDPAIRAAIPTSGGGGLTDVGIRSTQGGVKEAVILRVMGPLVLSIPSTDYPERNHQTYTSCNARQNSLRFIVPDVTDTGELEIACLDRADDSPGDSAPSLNTGDDVTLTNLRTGVQRCARAADQSRLRLAVASNLGDRLALTIWHGHAITDYGTCSVRPDAVIKNTVDTWQVVEGDCNVHCGHIPPGASATSMVPRVTTRGAPLFAPAEGMGIRRQTPEMRRFLLLAQVALDAGDPISFAPLYFLRRPAGHAQHALLTMNTVGDQAVPLSTGNAFARAAGVLPFFGPDAPTEYLEYATPRALWQRYGRTADRVLADHYVFEGIAALNRFPIPGHDDYLFDADDLDEGAQGFHEQTLSPSPLRLVRAFQPVGSPEGLAAAWAPSLAPWTGATGPVGGVVNAYIEPRGKHGYGLSDPGLPWDPATYLLNLTARFFATDGQDVYYRSHPTEHACMATSSCGFITPLPAN